MNKGTSNTRAVRHWSPSVGTSFRSIWAPDTILWNLRSPHSVQCRSRWISEYSDSRHPQILRWCFRFVPSYKCRRRHRRYVFSLATRSRHVCIRGCTVHGSYTRPNRRRFPWRNGRLALGGRSHGNLHRCSMDNWLSHHT